MFRILYVLWALLPLTLLLMAGWGFLKPYFKVYGQENIKLYFNQGVFCAIGLAAAILIDQSSWFEPMVESVSMGMLDIMVARWLLYPGILVGMAWTQKMIWKEPARVAPTKSRY